MKEFYLGYYTQAAPVGAARQEAVGLRQIGRETRAAEDRGCTRAEGEEATTDMTEGTDRHGPIRGDPFGSFDPRFLFSIFGIALLMRPSRHGVKVRCNLK